MVGIYAEESDRGKEIGRDRLEERKVIINGGEARTTSVIAVRVTAVNRGGHGRGGGGYCHLPLSPPMPLALLKQKANLNTHVTEISGT